MRRGGFLRDETSGALVMSGLDYSAFLADDGAWTHCSTDPRALVHRGFLYFGHVRTDGSVMVSQLNLTTRVLRTFNLRGVMEVDDHDNPSLCALPDGRLILFYCKHAAENVMRYRIQSTVDDVNVWGTEQTNITNVAGAAGFAYANARYLSTESRIYLFCRGADYTQVMTYSDDNGSTWIACKAMFTSSEAGERPYVHYVSDGANRIHVFASNGHPRSITAGLGHMYHFYYDAADGYFHKSDGTQIATLASVVAGAPITAAQVTKVHDAGTDGGNAWPFNIVLDDSGNPVGTYTAYSDAANNTYRYARWTGSAWVVNSLLTGENDIYDPEDPEGPAPPEPQYVGGLAVDPDDVNVVWLSRHVSGIPEIQKWTTASGGASWSSQAITSGSVDKNIRPFAPAGRTAGCPDIVFLSGTYPSYTSYVMDVWAYPDVWPDPDAVPAWSGGSYSSVVLADSPFAYWRLGEASGTAAADSSSGGTNGGTYVNTPTLGVAGGVVGNTAAQFASASSERVLLTTLTGVGAGLGTTSWEYWVKTTATGQQAVFGTLNTGTSVFAQSQLNTNDLGSVAVGKTAFSIRDTAGKSIGAAIATNIYDGAWHHVVWVVTNAAANTITAYVDGVVVPVTIGTGSGGAPSSFANFGFAMTIGARNDRGTITQFVDGSIDEVAVYTTQLSASRVADHYAARNTN